MTPLVSRQRITIFSEPIRLVQVGILDIGRSGDGLSLAEGPACMATLAALGQARALLASRKFDPAMGVDALMTFENQSELSVRALAGMIHDDSIAHGGPPRQSDRHP